MPGATLPDKTKHKFEAGHRVKIYLHRFILQLPAGLLGDHRNGDGLDCRRTNLRAATNQQNIVNFDRSNKTSYRGVSFREDRKSRPWRAQISFKRKGIHLGYFETAEEAARAYDVKCIELFGEFAIINGAIE